MTIITVLAAMLLPALQEARKKANFASKLGITRGIDYTGCIAYWLFAEGGGQTTKDITKTIGVSSQGGKNPGTIYGPKWVKESRHGNNCCLYFDGVDDFVDIGNGIDFGGKSAYSVEAWIKRESSGTMLITGWTYNRMAFLTTASTIQMRHHNQASVDQVLTASYTFSNDQWYHVASTYSASKGMELFVNGVSVGKDSGLTDKPSTNNLGQIKRIGKSDDYSRYFKGTIDEVAIYDKTLTKGEIEQHYRLGKP